MEHVPPFSVVVVVRVEGAKKFIAQLADKRGLTVTMSTSSFRGLRRFRDDAILMAFMPRAPKLFAL
jgi:hypothetical protein